MATEGLSPLKVKDRQDGVPPDDTSAASSPRRSGRACISTTIQIGGNTVLRQNNYTVTGSNYVYHAENATRNEDTKASTTEHDSSHEKKAAGSPQKKKAKTFHPGPAHIARQNHNRGVLAATEAKLPLRRRFFAKHRKRLEPFCEEHVLAATMNCSSGPLQQKQPFHTAVRAPQMIRATLRDYQLRGLDFMVKMHRQNLGMLLGDEMGLGKTLQSISLLCYLKEHEYLTGPSLVICPLSVLSSWCHELQTWAPSLKYFRLHASSAEEQARQKQELHDHATEYDVILTTYDMAKVPALLSFYQRVHFHYLVLDECQKIKGHKTQLAAAVRKIHKGNTLLLTGTPLQNNLVELWALLNFLFPEVFTTMTPFEEHFNLTPNAVKGRTGIVVDKDFLLKTQQLLELFMLRRLKSEVEKLLPGKLETKVYCPLSKTQTFWYKSLLLKDMNTLANTEDIGNDKGHTAQHYLGATRFAMLRQLFMQLRKCCNHPYVFDGAEANVDKTTLTDLVSASGKLSVLDMLLVALFRKGNRAVIFSQFCMVLDVLEDYCIMRGWEYCRFDGSTNRARRNYLIRRFNETDSPYFLFIISTRSGGMGLNLQSADTAILFDSDWNPQSDIQAMARVHRIGQTKAVHVYRLVSSGTVEERMLERAEKKLLLEMVNRESKDASSFEPEEMARGLSTRELLEDIKFGCEAVFGNAGNNELPSWEDIDHITDRSRTESDSAGELKGGASKRAISYDAEKEFSSTQHFGGADFRAIRKAMQTKQKKETPKNLVGIAKLWSEIQVLGDKRARKSRIVLLDGKGSGYGSATVPVLASNNYELLKGESSVFDRELTTSNKVNFQVTKRSKVVQHDHQDFCQVCGDGGDLVCCSLCPCVVHLQCVGLTIPPKLSYCCTHHRCCKCDKNRASSGGLLFPCQSCPLSFCEDCLPKDVRFLDKVERFESLGFDSMNKNVVYIHCSPECDTHAREWFGYKPPEKGRQMYKEPLDVTYNFGASISRDLEEAQAKVSAKVEEEEETALSKFMRTRGGKVVERNPKPGKPKSAGSGCPRGMEKLHPGTGVVLETFKTQSAAAKSVNCTSSGFKDKSLISMLRQHMKTRPNEPFMGFLFRFKNNPLMEKLCPTSGVVLENFMTLNAAATSVDSHMTRLKEHMETQPNKPFFGFVFRFKQQITSEENTAM